MHVSGSYSAISSIFEVQATQRTRRASPSGGSASFDTVSISEEAMAAYRNSLQKTATGPSQDAETEAQLTRWFTQWHSGANFSDEGIQGEVVSGGALLPENAALKASLEKEIDRHLREANYQPGELASPELLEKLRPLQQKLNAISALGATRILDEETLNTAAKFLQAMEEAWNESGSQGSSLRDSFLSAISSWKSQPQDDYVLQEKLRGLRDMTGASTQ